jgi:hypothetical protein
MVNNLFAIALRNGFALKNKLDLNRFSRMAETKVNNCFDKLKYVKTICIFALLYTNTI